MCMQAFAEVIMRVRQRIHSHCSDLSSSEWLTRYVLVDPVLRALGWDTEDPEQLIPEFSTGANRFDYALLKNGRPYIVVEVKALNANLQPALSQGVNGAVQLGAHYFVCTDGNIWEIYESHKPVPLPDKLVARVQINQTSLSEIVRVLVVMWRDAIIDNQSAPISNPNTQNTSQEPQPPQPDSQSQRELTLDQLSSYWSPKASPPSSIELPNGTTVAIRHWYEVLTVVAKYALPTLLQRGLLPMESPKIDTDPSRFTRPASLDAKWYIEVNANAIRLIQHSIEVVRHAKIDPKSIKCIVKY